VNYPDLPRAVRPGDRVQIDNGMLSVDVLARHGRRLECRVLDGGPLGSRKHINLPGVAVNLPSITAKDRDDIALGVAQEVDFIALSFARSAADVAELRDLLGAKSARTMKIVAKIENQEGVRNAEAIAAAADGVMVARGDLGIETDIAALPSVQRELVATCARLGKRCVVATHLMESMIDNPIPTRAEVTDVANAVYEGVDAIMLSGETSIGRYPVRVVEQLANIAEASERERGFALHEALAIKTDKQHLAAGAAQLADAVDAAGIVVITRRGVTADTITNCRPDHVPIFAFTNLSQTRRRLMLNRGVYAHRTPFSSDPEKTIRTALRVLREREGVGADEKVVVISDVLAQTPVEAIQLRTVGAD
jgi:pyruvate kinase